MSIEDSVKRAQEGNSIALQAIGLIYGDRNNSYGDALFDFDRAAKIMNATKDLTDRNYYTGKQIVQMLISVKQARRQYKYKQDTHVDMIGYTDILDKFDRRDQEISSAKLVADQVRVHAAKVEKAMLYEPQRLKRKYTKHAKAKRKVAKRK